MLLVKWQQLLILLFHHVVGLQSRLIGLLSDSHDRRVGVIHDPSVGKPHGLFGRAYEL